MTIRSWPRRASLLSVLVLAACGAGRSAAIATTAERLPGTSGTASAPMAPPRVPYTAPTMGAPLFPERVWYSDLDALVAASDDIVIAVVGDIGPAEPRPLPSSPQPPGTFTAPVVTLVVERNLLHPADAEPFTVFDMSAQSFVGRLPFEPGQRVLAFLGRVIDAGFPVTHGVLDHLLIEPGGQLRSMSGSTGTAVAPDAIARAGGAAFLDGAMLDQVAAEIVALRPAG